MPDPPFEEELDEQHILVTYLRRFLTSSLLVPLAQFQNVIMALKTERL